MNLQRAKEIIDELSVTLVSEELHKAPTVSVSLISYNQRPYIEEAVESILAQQLDVPFTLLIADDGSTDGTAEYLRQVQLNYPKQIHLMLAKENMYKHTKNNRLNLLRTFLANKAPFIARLEGDDKWLDPQKLNKQLAVLQAANNPYSGVVHDTKVVNGNEVYAFNPQGDGTTFSHAAVISELCPFHTSSVLFKADVLRELPLLFYKAPSADIVLFQLAAALGPLFRIKETMSLYRKDAGGVTHSSTHLGMEYHLGRMRMQRDLKAHFSPLFAAEYENVIKYHMKGLIEILKWKSKREQLALIERMRKEHGLAASLKLGKGLIS